MNFKNRIGLTILRTAYASVLAVFFFAVFNIVDLHYRSLRTGLVKASVSEKDLRPIQLTDYSASSKKAQTSVISMLSVSSPDVWGDRFVSLVLLCSVTFLLIYFGIPVYNFITAVRPIKRINEHVMNNRGPSSQPAFINKNISALNNGLQNLFTQRSQAEAMIEAINNGNYEMVPPIPHENDVLGNALVRLQRKLKSVSEDEQQMTLVHSNLQQLERILKEESDWEALVTRVITLIAKSTGAGVGVIYGWETESSVGVFKLLSAYGISQSGMDETIVCEHGQLGETARIRKLRVIANVPKGYLTIHSGLGEASATHIVIAPLLFKDQLYGAFEVGLFREPGTFELEWLERASESIAAHFFNHRIHNDAKRQLENLAQKQAAELVEIHRLQRETFQELELKLKEVEEEKYKNIAILEGCVDGVLVFDDNGKIDFCNEAGAEMLGMSREDILQKPLPAILPVIICEEHNDWKILYRNGVVEKEILVRTEASFVSATGNDTDVLITCTQVRANTGIVFTFFVQKISIDLF